MLPLNDAHWPRALRASLYALGLIYCFLGVAIVADLFMNSIETITSRRRKVTFKTGKVVHAFLWNDTVANLSLMALGSSAPEIFLSVIDLFRKKMHSSDLGSATIAGSAAFNLLVIIGVCIMCIPDGEMRVIEQYAVFVVTAIVSLLAYLWVAFILVVWTPDVVDIWEAVVTLLFLPPLIYVSYAADQGRFDQLQFWKDPKEQPARSRPRFSSSPSIKNEGSDKNPTRIRTSEDPQQPAKGAIGIRVDDEAKNLGSDGRKSSEMNSDVSCQEECSEAPGSEGCTNVDVRSVPVAPRANTTDRTLHQAHPTSGVGINQLNGPPPRPSTLAGPGSIVRSSHSTPRSSIADRRSIMSSLSADPRLKTKLSRGFSHNSFSTDMEDIEQAARMANRRKSIASAHVLHLNRLRKSPTNLSMDRQQSNVTLGQLSTLQSDVATVQMLIDRQFISGSLDKKTIKVVRKGCLEGELRIHWTVTLCRKQSDHIVRMAVTDAYQDTLGMELQETENWFAGLETTEGESGIFTLEAFRVEHTLMVDKPVFPKDFCQDFVVSLRNVEVVGLTEAEVSLGHIRSSYVMMEQSPSAGMLSFSHESCDIDGSTEARVLEVVVVRQEGCCGRITCAVATEALSAVSDFDYVEVDELITFEEGITEMIVKVEVLGKRPGKTSRDFLVVLSGLDDDECARFNPLNDGGVSSAIMLVKVGSVSPELAKGSQVKALPKVSQYLDAILNLNKIQKGMIDWRGQWVSAILCNGSWEEQQDASIMDWAFHLMSMPWMILFAAIPPTIFAGGWVSFTLCLIFIAGVTAIIADLAALFGCCCEVPDIITAVTFVALGTSMPDLFASKVAAAECSTADASIVNVTGSNSVNVFLGLGLPWTIATIYWHNQPRSLEWIQMYPNVHVKYPGTQAVFAVPAANLGFSVVCFCCACLAALALLVLRRRTVDCELGGPANVKLATASTLVFYWLGYVATVSWRALEFGKASRGQELSMIGGVLFCETCISVWPITLMYREAKKKRLAREFAMAEEQGEEGPKETDADKWGSSQTSGSGEAKLAADNGSPHEVVDSMPAIPREPAASNCLQSRARRQECRL